MNTVTHVKLRTDIDSGNQALVDCPEEEIARILTRILKRIEQGERIGSAVDINGNRVGDWAYEETTD